MVFSSEVFLFGFLPLFLAVYYLTPARWKNITLLLFSVFVLVLQPAAARNL